MTNTFCGMTRPIFSRVVVPVIGIPILLAGCGGGGVGGGENGTTANPPAQSSSGAIQNGLFLDSAVQGLTFRTPTQSGQTDANGTFSYLTAETVSFSIGNIALGSAAAGSRLTPVNLVSSARGDPANTAVITILRLLQSLDSDGNPANGIEISAAVHQQAEDLPPLDATEANFDTNAELLNFIQNATGQAALVDSVAALSHYHGSDGAGALVSTGPALSTLAIGSEVTFQQSFGIFTSEVLTFEILEGTVSFLLHLVGNDVGRITFNNVTAPDGTSVDLSYFSCPAGRGYCNLLIPFRPDTAADAGIWSYQLQRRRNTGNNFQVKISRRHGLPTSTNPAITIKPFITGTRFSISSIKTALARLTTIYAKSGLTVSVLAPTRVEGARYAVLSSNFNDATTSALISAGAPDKVNIFFVEQISSTSDLLGSSPTTPASMGLAGTWNGIMIDLSAHQVGLALNTRLLGETAAHEMGHFLGLFHTTERNAVSHDPLADTPECATGESAEACAETDGANLMFWVSMDLTAGVISEQTVLTNDQFHVIRHAPIVRQ